ncbi:hypothetical protein CYG49_04485 [Candidatus Saccharibacteria bacterium]|nr:MAG: hypothetical protein CYG49_04485 [Candidatus Saccharibacteria bacterium]
MEQGDFAPDQFSFSEADLKAFQAETAQELLALQGAKEMHEEKVERVIDKLAKNNAFPYSADYIHDIRATIEDAIHLDLLTEMGDIDLLDIVRETCDTVVEEQIQQMLDSIEHIAMMLDAPGLHKYFYGDELLQKYGIKRLLGAELANSHPTYDTCPWRNTLDDLFEGEGFNPIADNTQLFTDLIEHKRQQEHEERHRAYILTLATWLLTERAGHRDDLSNTAQLLAEYVISQLKDPEAPSVYLEICKGESTYPANVIGSVAAELLLAHDQD